MHVCVCVHMFGMCMWEHECVYVCVEAVVVLVIVFASFKLNNAYVALI